MEENPTRRPIPQREAKWAKQITAKLIEYDISPNAISIASIGFAFLGFLLFCLAGFSDGFFRSFCLIFAALCVLLRLLCNLFDGMVAIEGNKQSLDGALWNEFPDRIADVLFIVGMGLCLAYNNLIPISIAWIAAVGAVLTAYIREMGEKLGTAPDFSGPFAKPQRMWLVGGSAVLSAFEGLWGWNFIILSVAMYILLLGTIITLVSRVIRLRNFLISQ